MSRKKPEGPGLSHVAPDGSARMVDVGEKAVTRRTAVASGRVVMSEEAFRLVRDHQVAKGDVLSVARVAGIQAAKRTAELIPLCHPLVLDLVELRLTLDEALPGIQVEGTVRTDGRTGVEMEALTAVAVACLTVYDMTKAADRAMRIEAIRLLEKTGGRSGSYRAS